MSEGIRVETDDGVSRIELPKDREHTVFINMPKGTQFVVYDDGEFSPIEIRYGKSSLVLMLEKDQRTGLVQALGFEPGRNGGTYRRLQRLIDQSGCLKVQRRAKQLYTLDKAAGGSNHRSHNFKKWFAGEKSLPGRLALYYEDYLPDHGYGHPVTEDCRTPPPSPR